MMKKKEANRGPRLMIFVWLLLCRAQTVKLELELARSLHGKLSSAGSDINMSQKDILPWEVARCRDNAALIMKQHPGIKHPAMVPEVVNEAIRAMGYSGRCTR
jgi:hypothetical protein